MLDLFATVIDILDGCCNDAHVVVSVDAARDSEAKQVEATETVLTGNGIAVGENITDFTSADTGFTIKLYCESLCGEFLFGDVSKNHVGIEENSVTTGGTLIRNTVFIEKAGEEFNLMDASVKVVKFSVLIKSYSKSLHIAAVHTTISKIALERNSEAFGSLEPVFMTGSDEAAHIDYGIFLSGHRHAIGKREHFLDNFLDSAVFVAFFASLDEIRVFGKAG